MADMSDTENFYMHVNPEDVDDQLDVDVRDGQVLVWSPDGRAHRMSPEEACTVATNIIRAAAVADPAVGPVSVFMPRDMWVNLIDAADAGIESAEWNDGPGSNKSAWRESVKVVEAVVKFTPAADLS